jgi:hypothetical protein
LKAEMPIVEGADDMQIDRSVDNLKFMKHIVDARRSMSAG